MAIDSTANGGYPFAHTVFILSVCCITMGETSFVNCNIVGTGGHIHVWSPCPACTLERNEYGHDDSRNHFHSPLTFSPIPDAMILNLLILLFCPPASCGLASSPVRILGSTALKSNL